MSKQMSGGKPAPSVLASTGSMAIATLISRITGFFKILLMAAVLGPGMASAFNTSNQLPNLISELVLGAVLTAIVIPVLVRAEQEDDDRGAAFIRRLLTAAMTVFAVAAVVSVLAAPWLTRLMLPEGGEVDVGLATAFAYLLLPQILFYGAAGLFTAVLNTRSVFKPGAWAPVVNNVVAIATLALYFAMPGEISLNPVRMGEPKLLVLGIGTTLGVVAQALVLLPALRRQKIDMRPLWGLDPRLKRFAGMGVAIVVYVLISQAGLVVTNRITAGADAAGPAIYSFVWMLLQVPYGIIGVTLLTAVMPQLSRNAASNNNRAVVSDLTMATKLTMVALIPIVAFFTAEGPSIGRALFNYGNFGENDASLLGLTLSFSAFTLIPYSLVLLHLRVFYAREQAWIPTFIIIGITAAKITLSVIAPHLVDPQHVVVALGTANGLGFIVGAIVGISLLRRALGNLNMRVVAVLSAKVLAASAVGAAVILGLDAVLGITEWAELHGGLASMLTVALKGTVMLGITFALLIWLKIPEVLQVSGSISRLFRRFLPGGAAPAPKQPAQGDAVEFSPAASHPIQPPMVPYSEFDPFTYVPLLPRVDAALRTLNVSDPDTSASKSPSGDRSARKAPRGPRLIPGAMIAGGRYRLLARHGGSEGLQFWQARDTRLEREVALTFVDAQQDPSAAPRAPKDDPEEILTRTLRLGRLNSPGVARVLDVVRGSSGGIVVSEWVEGSALHEISAMHPPAIGAARAIATLAGAAEDAHRLGASLGIDHPDRIRISTDGAAVLAFPATLSSSSQAGDVRGLGAALYALLTNEWPADEPAGRGEPHVQVGSLKLALLDPRGLPVEPHTIRPEIPFEISAVAMRAITGNSGIRTAATVQHVLSQAGAGLDEAPTVASSAIGPRLSARPLDQDTDGAPDPERRKKMTIALSVLGVAVVAVVTYLVLLGLGAFGATDEPLSQQSFGLTPTPTAPAATTAEAPAAPAAPVGGPIQVADIVVYSPLGVPDSPATVRNAIDGNPGTFWATDQYFQQLPALKSGVGLMNTFEVPAKLQSVGIDSPSPGTRVEIRSAPSPDATLDQMQVIGSAVLGDGHTDIPVTEGQAGRYVLVWITQLGGSSGQFQSKLAQITFIGTE